MLKYYVMYDENLVCNNPYMFINTEKKDMTKIISEGNHP
jgi:hypothetical protein